MEAPTWQKIRDLYPICSSATYLKSASISLGHPRVQKAMNHWITDIGNKAAIDEARFFDFLMESRTDLASFLNCSPEDVTLLENSSHNMNLVALMLAQKELKEGKSEIVTIADEFPSSILPLFYHRFDVIQVPSNHGHFNESDLFNAVNDKTAAVIISHVQFSTGLRLDLEKLSSLAQSHNTHLILNTTQSLGVFECDLSKIKVSALTSSCHKWLGAGIGQAILYLSPDFRKERSYPFAGWCSVEDPFAMINELPHPREDVSALQLGSLPFALIAGVSESLKVINEIGRQNIQDRILELSSHLRQGIKELGYNPLGARQLSQESGIVSFEVKEADALVDFLAHRKIYVNNRRGRIRASVHFYNNKQDVDCFLKALKDYSS
jgi:selenocysteine lyase/cysteine desulfurase